MRLSGFLVRKFGSAAVERAFRMDYARRYASQRRLAGASLILIWTAVVIRDWLLLNTLDPSILFHVGYVRLAGALGMALPLWLMWGPRAFDERWAVRLLCVVTLSCWFALLGLVNVYPPVRVGQEIFPGFFVVLFLIFTIFRLRTITAAWLVGLCVVTYHLIELLQYIWGIPTPWSHWFTTGAMVLMMYFVGIGVCIQFEFAARREFVFRRTLRAAKARVEAASRVVKQQNERMREVVREKERFFSSAYHDIQQPLAAINLFIRSARIKLEDEHAASHDLDVIEETARDLLDMFKDIQDYSELGSYVPHLAPVDTQTVLMESDHALFKRALSNFMSNAIKYTSVGGIVVGWVEIGERLRIDVWDTGVGISPAHRDVIFAEYYQIDNPGRDRSKGLGLGLSIVSRVVGILPKHSMRFWSVKGRGSRFSLYAPISQLAPVIVTEDQANAACTSILNGRYILLCDDEPIVLEGLRRLFLSAGALVDSAGSMKGFEAILAEDGRAPDVIITDIRIRDGPNGIEVAERIRQHFAWAGVLPVAFITGELVSPRALRDFVEPFVLLRKSSTPESTLAEVSRLVADRPPTGFGHVRDP
jgi:signal transduction histidine kinase